MTQPPFDYTALFTRYKGLAKELPFTREDVRLLRMIRDEAYDGMDIAFWIGQDRADDLAALTERIEKLLPPEG